MFVKIFGPNLNDQTRGTFHVHLDGCRDNLKYGPGTRYGGEVFAAHEATVNVDDRVGVVEYIYSDQLRESPGTKPEDWLHDFWFAPCVASLPEFKQDEIWYVTITGGDNKFETYGPCTEEEADRVADDIRLATMAPVRIHQISKWDPSESVRELIEARRTR